MFSSCVKLPENVESEPLIVDLKDVIQTRVWKQWYSSLSTLQKRAVKRKHFDIEVPDNYFVFEHIEEDPSLKVSLGGVRGSEDGPNATDGNGAAVPGGGKVNGSASNVESARRQAGLNVPAHSGLNRSDSETVSLETKFHNDTAQKQMYHFRFNKVRRTELNVSCQRGFTFGARTDFSLGLPQILGSVSLAASAELNYHVTKVTGQTFEDSVEMEATSDIAVGANSCYTADVRLDEVRVHKRFTSVSRLTLPQGHASIYIKRKKNGRCVFVYDLHALWDTFGEGIVPCARAVLDQNKQPRQDQVDFVVDGVVTGTLACNHQILLSSDESKKQPLLERSRKGDDGSST